jgi:hypothetical protein
VTGQGDDQVLRELEITKLQLNSEKALRAETEKRLAEKDKIIESHERELKGKDDVIELLKSANKDRASVNTGDARMLDRCESQHQLDLAEIQRLRNPGFWRSIFNKDTISGGLAGFSIGRATAGQSINASTLLDRFGLQR